eukprot:226845-Hanusia_phi.AAC.1
MKFPCTSDKFMAFRALNNCHNLSVQPASLGYLLRLRVTRRRPPGRARPARPRPGVPSPVLPAPGPGRAAARLSNREP